ncbi:MAG: nitrous oxide reductase family maturation protein NosD, partial [Anaerolineae bacterium]|nr:nitrous oxide reductase family maturation protein NosD [Anaerolineae bacterium]
MRRWAVLALVLVAGLLVSGRVQAQAEGQVIAISAEDLATAVSQASPGDTIEVTGGVYKGSLLIDKPLTLIGKDWPVIDGENEGSVVTITAPGSTLRGFVIKNSGQSLANENSGIAVEAENTLIENNRFEDTLFGIYTRQAHNTIIRNNVISSKDLEPQRRGDPIRVWYSNGVTLENNKIDKGRDVVLWYSEDLTVQNNDVSNGRYGLHFMYCDDATIEYNRLYNNSVGLFMMYSRRVHIQNNTIANNRGPSGYGIGLKDMDDAIITNNLILDNRIGVHLDTSPREVDSIGRFEGNVLAYNDIGVQMMPSVRHNEFISNSFVENEEQMAIAGGGKQGDNWWTVNDSGNYWSDYAGYDDDGDGLGEMAYRSDRLFENMMEKEPQLRLFLYSPATNAIEFAAKA